MYNNPFVLSSAHSVYCYFQRIKGGFLNVMRYINPRFTYLLTFQLTRGFYSY